MEYFGIKKGTYLRLNLFFKEPKHDSEIRISLKMKIENYLANLLEKGKGELHRSLTNGVKEFSKINETISFPNTKIFESLKVKVCSHPEKSKLGYVKPHSLTASKRIYKINFQKKDKTTFKHDTLIEFTIKNP